MSDKAIEVADAFEIIKKAMKDDNPSEGGSYAHSWHCNIAMSVFDTLSRDITNNPYPDDFKHVISNEAATAFMKLCFDVDTKA